MDTLDTRPASDRPLGCCLGGSRSKAGVDVSQDIEDPQCGYQTGFSGQQQGRGARATRRSGHRIPASPLAFPWFGCHVGLRSLTQALTLKARVSDLPQTIYSTRCYSAGHYISRAGSRQPEGIGNPSGWPHRLGSRLFCRRVRSVSLLAFPGVWGVPAPAAVLPLRYFGGYSLKGITHVLPSHCQSVQRAAAHARRNRNL